MYSKSHLAFRWLRYLTKAENGRGHGIHSPFVYDLVTEVFQDSRHYYAYEKIEQVRKAWLRNQTPLSVTELGAGPGSGGTTFKKISSISKKSLSSKKFGRLLFRLANHYRATKIIELGSSLGISGAYLASADSVSRVITLEGSAAIAAVASETFRLLELKNISSLVGDFNSLLPWVLKEYPEVDLVFIDGNHRKKPVMDYFEAFLARISPSSLIIIHDIHWSREMEEAWAEIRQHPKVKMSIDIFTAGLLFFRDEFLVKQHFIIRF